MGRRKKLGDVFAIPLPNGTYAFARLHQEGTVAIYKQRSETEDGFQENDEYEFTVPVYRFVFREWHFVKNIPFSNEEESYAPPYAWFNQLTGAGSIYYKGVRTPCSYEECKDLEVLAVWDGNQLVDRIMGDHKWEKAIKDTLNKALKGIH